MNTAETIYELVKTLPEDKANVVLAFAEFICQRPQPTESSEQPSFSDFFGILKDSPNFNGDSVAIQNSMRGDRITHNDNASLPQTTQSDPFTAAQQLRDSIQVQGNPLSTSIASNRSEERLGLDSSKSNPYRYQL